MADYPRYLLRDFLTPGRAVHLARLVYEPGALCPLHDHDFAELFFLEAGRCLHRVNGHSVEVARGEVVFIRPRDAHLIRAGDEPFTLVNLAFAAGVLTRIRQRFYRGRKGWPWPAGGLPVVHRLGEEDLHMLTAHVEALSRGDRDAMALESFLLTLLTRLRTPTTPTRDPPPDWLHDAVERYARLDPIPPGLDAFLHLTGRGLTHVNRVCRRCYGVTTTNLINRLRMEQAARLLRMTHRSILDVALDTGYDNLGYFYRRFRAQFRVTPRHYRRRYHAPATGVAQRVTMSE